MKLYKKLVKRYNKRGFTLVEVLVALGLLAVVFPIAYKLFSLGTNLMNKSTEIDNKNSKVTHRMVTGKYQDIENDPDVISPGEDISNTTIEINFDDEKYVPIDVKQKIYYYKDEDGEVKYRVLYDD